MQLEFILERLHLGLAVALLLAGAVTAWTSTNVAKRVAGISVALTAALIALAVLGAPAALLVAAAGVAFAHLVVGAALLVRLQESYGGVETPEFDAADAQSDAPESGG
ncbi:hypothetical protein [Terricaulis sp.]|uniref:hypothetical protein n=1 Tax=Terricaulis sp. TaxID=2768686 RepID=UPI003782D8B1